MAWHDKRRRHSLVIERGRGQAKPVKQKGARVISGPLVYRTVLLCYELLALLHRRCVFSVIAFVCSAFTPRPYLLNVNA